MVSYNERYAGRCTYVMTESLKDFVSVCMARGCVSI